jgi:hypothetical protein
MLYFKEEITINNPGRIIFFSNIHRRHKCSVNEQLSIQGISIPGGDFNFNWETKLRFLCHKTTSAVTNLDSLFLENRKLVTLLFHYIFILGLRFTKFKAWNTEVNVKTTTVSWQVYTFRNKAMLYCDKPVLCLCIMNDKGAETIHTR